MANDRKVLPGLTHFDDREAASRAAASLVAEQLERSLRAQPEVTLVVSGGSTPADCYHYLSQHALPWDRVAIALSDERCVAETHRDSNTRMVRETLLRNAAAGARLIPLEEQVLRAAPATWTLALLGMGTDGHFASLFPDAENLSEGLATTNALLTIDIQTAASPYRRRSLSWAALMRCQTQLLLAFGEAKARVLAAPAGTPVATLLASPNCRVFWAP